ncbi:hypothetical protein CR513_42919, partial [Mucuna pruriens]
MSSRSSSQGFEGLMLGNEVALMGATTSSDYTSTFTSLSSSSNVSSAQPIQKVVEAEVALDRSTSPHKVTRWGLESLPKGGYFPHKPLGFRLRLVDALSNDVMLTALDSEEDFMMESCAINERVFMLAREGEPNFYYLYET